MGKQFRKIINLGFLFILLSLIFSPLNSLFINGLESGDYPVARYGHRMVYYPEDESIILFGGEYGYESGVYLNATWSFDLELKSWTNLNIEDGPSARYDHGLVYDSTNNKIIMFGGLSTENYSRLSDTWILDLELNEWTYIPFETKPLPRSSFGFYYDPVIQAAVLFGGYSQIDTKYDDTWLFFPNNNTWLRIYCSLNPPESYGQQMVYDTKNDVGVLFGGRSNSLSDETWHFNSTELDWLTIVTTVKPIKRYWHAMTYSSVDNKSYIFGGRNDDYSYNAIYQTAAYDSTTQDWETFTLDNHPSARALSNIVCHEKSKVIVLFGGTYNFGDPVLSDMWYFDISDETWTQIDYTSTNVTSLNLANIVLIGIVTLSFFIVKPSKKRT